MGNLCCCRTYKLKKTTEYDADEYKANLLHSRETTCDDSPEYSPDTSGSLVWNLRMLTAESENKRLKAELEQLRSEAEAKNARHSLLMNEVAMLRQEVEDSFRNERKRYIIVNMVTRNSDKY